MAKLLAADASWEAANVALDTHGGFGLPWNTTSSASFGKRGFTKSLLSIPISSSPTSRSMFSDCRGLID